MMQRKAFYLSFQSAQSASALPRVQSKNVAGKGEPMIPQHATGHCGQTVRRYSYCVLVGLMAILSGCGSGPTKKTALIKPNKHVETSAAVLSARNQSRLGLYSSEIENAADKIILQSPSAVTRRQALEWKAEAIPVLQTALLNTDPVAAALDAWAFILQMKAYMEQPLVKQGWGESYPVVTNTLNRMDIDMEQLIHEASPSANLPAARQRVSSWAEAHPIQAGLSSRKSADALLIRQAEQSDLGTRASIRAVAESIGDLTARLDSYNVYLPKQARWQAELLLSDLSRDPEISSAMSGLAVLSSAVDRTAGSMEHMPELIGQAHEAVLADVEGQRLGLQDFLREERVQAMDSLNQERIATMADVRGERLAATADLRAERQIVLDALHNEQVAVMNELHAASETALKEFDTKARGLIDHFFLRALELFLLALVLCSLLAWFLLLRITRRRGDRGERLYDRAA